MSKHERDTPTPAEGPVPVPPSEQDVTTRPEHTREAPDAEVVRPDQQEGLGPAAGLFTAAGAEAAALGTTSEAVEADAVEVGAEAEGVESAQIFGLLAATVVALIAIVVGVGYLVTAVGGDEAIEREGELEARTIREIRADALALIGDDAWGVESAENGVYRVPLAHAQRLVVAEYGAAQAGGLAPYFTEPYYGSAARTSYNLAFARGEAPYFDPSRPGLDRSLLRLGGPSVAGLAGIGLDAPDLDAASGAGTSGESGNPFPATVDGLPTDDRTDNADQ